MSKPFNPALNADIKKLHEFPKNTRKHEYKLLFNDVMNRHKISRATVYAELSKENPGTYKKPDRRSRRVRISKKEMDLVAGYIVAHKTNTEISRLMSIEMGFSYTPHRLMQVKDKLQAASKKILNSEPKIINHIYKAPKRSSAFPAVAAGAGEPSSAPNPLLGKGSESIDARKFFYALACIDLKDLKAIVNLNFWGNEFMVNARVIKTSLDHMAASASVGGKDIAEYAKFEIESLLIQQLRNAKHNSFFKPGELKQLTSVLLTLVQEYSTQSSSGGYTLDDVYRVVTHFAPSADREEIAKLLEP